MFKKIVAFITGKSEPVNPQITDAVTQIAPEKSPQAQQVEAAVKEKIVKPAVKAKADGQAAKKTRTKKNKQ